MNPIIRKKGKLPKAIRPEEFIELIKNIPKKDLKTKVSFLLGYGAGMRVSEIFKLERINVRKDSIFIKESKYGVERVVPLPKGWRKEFDKLIPLNISIRTLQRKFEKYSKEAKLNPSYTFHSLRHGFATRALERGVPLNQVQVMLGHSNISTTSIYTKANPKDALQSYEELF